MLILHARWRFGEQAGLIGLTVVQNEAVDAISHLYPPPAIPFPWEGLLG